MMSRKSLHSSRPFVVQEVREAPHSERHISIVVPASVVARERQDAIKTLATDLVVDGFRPGKVPPHIAEQHIPQERIHHEVVRRVIEPHLHSLLEEHHLDPVAPPLLNVEEREGDLHVTLAVPVFPEVPLPPYREIAQAIREAPATPPSPEEVSQTAEEMLSILRRAHAARHSHDTSAEVQSFSSAALPPLTDEVARELGPYNSVAALRAALQREAVLYHTKKAEETRRGAFVAKLLEAAGSFPVPLPFVELELNRLVQTFAHQLAAAGITLEQYLASQSPERRETIKKSWQEEAERRVRAHLILERIAEEEGITVSEEEVRSSVDAILAQNPSLDRTVISRHLQQEERIERLFRSLLGEPQEPPPEATLPADSSTPTAERTTSSGIIIPGTNE